MEDLKRPRIFLIGGRAVTSSIDIAIYFGLSHLQILEKIEKINFSICQEAFKRSFNVFNSYRKNIKQSSYHVSLEGFILLDLEKGLKKEYLKVFHEYKSSSLQEAISLS